MGWGAGGGARARGSVHRADPSGSTFGAHTKSHASPASQGRLPLSSFCACYFFGRYHGAFYLLFTCVVFSFTPLALFVHCLCGSSPSRTVSARGPGPGARAWASTACRCGSDCASTAMWSQSRRLPSMFPELTNGARAFCVLQRGGGVPHPSARVWVSDAAFWGWPQIVHKFAGGPGVVRERDAVCHQVVDAGRDGLVAVLVSCAKKRAHFSFIRRRRPEASPYGRRRRRLPRRVDGRPVARRA